MDLKTYDELVARGRKRPIATMVSVLALLVCFFVGAYLIAFSSERGRRAGGDPAIQNVASNSSTGADPSSQPTGDRHTYQFAMQGRRFTGQSTNPFEEGQGYRARVEFCERYGIENVEVIVSCYLTIIPTANLTVSNSENLTTASYEDGSVAVICCMYIGESPVAPIYRIRLPRGTMTRQTYRRGEVVHVLLNIPNADPTRNLDAINFSPGEGAPTVLFPLRGNYIDHIFSTVFINAHRGDPELEQLLQKATQMRQNLRAREEPNRGLTYPQ